MPLISWIDCQQQHTLVKTNKHTNRQELFVDIGVLNSSLISSLNELSVSGQVI